MNNQETLEEFAKDLIEANKSTDLDVTLKHMVAAFICLASEVWGNDRVIGEIKKQESLK